MTSSARKAAADRRMSPPTRPRPRQRTQVCVLIGGFSFIILITTSLCSLNLWERLPVIALLSTCSRMESSEQRCIVHGSGRHGTKPAVGRGELADVLLRAVQARLLAGCSVTASFSGAAAWRSLMGCYLAACSVETSLPAWLLARVSWDAALQHALS